MPVIDSDRPHQDLVVHTTRFALTYDVMWQIIKQNISEKDTKQRIVLTWAYINSAESPEDKCLRTYRVYNYFNATNLRKLPKEDKYLFLDNRQKLREAHKASGIAPDTFTWDWAKVRQQFYVLKRNAPETFAKFPVYLRPMMGKAMKYYKAEFNYFYAMYEEIRDER